MRRPARIALVSAAGTAALAALAGSARCDDAPALERVRAALATARHDLEDERARGEAARSEASRVTTRAQGRRDAALGRLDAARQARRDLGTREAWLRAETEKLASESDALEIDLAPARDLCRRLAAELATRDVLASPARRAERTEKTKALVHEADDAGADLGSLAGSCLEILEDDARDASRLAVFEDQVEVEGRRVHGRLLVLGPGAWFLGQDGTEATSRRSPDRKDGAFVPCPGEGIAGAFAALDRGERRLELPVDVTGEALGRGSLVHRSLELIRQGGLAIAPLALLSFVSLLVLIERLLARRRVVGSAVLLTRDVRAALESGDLDSARSRVVSGGALGRALLHGLEDAPSRESFALAADGAQKALLADLRARTWLLGTVGSSAPFVGLFGTVVGIVRAFEDISRTGAAGFNVVAGGIAEALVATAAGIVVAVFAVIAYNALQAWSATTAAALALRVEEALERRRGEPRGA